MKAVRNGAAEPSMFHKGEQILQARAGKREAMESIARRVIRPYMPDQHRDFFAQLPFMVVGSVDAAGWPWASLVAGKPGFIQSPDAKTLRIDAAGASGDPLHDALRPGAPLGLLGIELSTRRRNRMNGRLQAADADGFTIAVDQSFGNCPQYIQTRHLELQQHADSRPEQGADAFTTFSNRARALISGSDTFFVSSFVEAADRPDIEGVDVSHRGGRPGFVRVDGDVLTVPDFPGNLHFNTLGNFLVNPKAGLLFTDFDTGDLLSLTGTVELLDEEDEAVKAFRGAERGWRFTLDHGVWLRGAMPFRFTLQERSPNTLLTGDWQQAQSSIDVAQKRDQWRTYRVARVEDESTVVRSFYLEPVQDPVLPEYSPGQYLTVRIGAGVGTEPLVRTYTLSSCPSDAHYRISVKREADGEASQLLHRVLAVGDMLEARAPRGDFFIDAAQTRPALLFAGGVGVTPMISMARHVASEGIRTRHYRPVRVFHATHNTAERAFAKEFREVETSSQGRIQYCSVVSRPEPGAMAGVDADYEGHITRDLLQALLPLDDYDCYLCGPSGFMQAMYDALRSLGIADARIFAEAFGPAALKRQTDSEAPSKQQPEETDVAMVKFVRSGLEQTWTPESGTLLEFAEEQGLQPEFGCRSGACGTCATGIKAGTVAHRNAPTGDVPQDQVLICSAVPAKDTRTAVLDL